MIGKNTIKLIKSLSDKKNRIAENLFVAEGDKIVKEVLNSSFTIERIYATTTFLENNPIDSGRSKHILEVSNEEVKKASLLKTPQNCIAICQLPVSKKIPYELAVPLSIFLDDVQDPGNVGTIIRICDWFGISQIFSSPGSADFFSPKVIQASMGSFCRVEVISSTFDQVASLAKKSGVKIMGAFLDGENIYASDLREKILLVMGNEGNGINLLNAQKVDKKISIPHFSTTDSKAESLNVAVATAVICAEIQRQMNYSK